MNLSKTELKNFLDQKVRQYNNPKFIESDPIQIPHRFTQKEDIEIIAFLVATIAWGNRKSIIKSGQKLTEITGESPYDFVINYDATQQQKCNGFVHRTFNAVDLDFFFRSIQHIYKNHGGLEVVFKNHATKKSIQPAISSFKNLFFSIPHPARTQKHISNPQKNSAAKRINMFLRWMVRNDGAGVDFGIWKSISPAILSCPLDVHSGNIARKLGLLTRKQNDAKALNELDTSLRKLDTHDPVKYDYALFGLGVFESF